MTQHHSALMHRIILGAARWIVRRNQKWIANPLEAQEKSFHYLIKKATNTRFGKDHHFSSIKNYKEFKRSVPVKDYEAQGPYFKRVQNGEKNVLWPGRPIYFCTTSGTTSGTKYIPITKQSMPNFTRSARDAVLQYIANTGHSGVLDGKFIFVQGSPVLKDLNGIKTGRLSGIVAHHVPIYLQRNRKPGFKSNSIEKWDKKIEAIVHETMDENMTAVGGIPPWVQMYFESLLSHSGKRAIKELFPNLTLLVTGGVNFDPYQKTFEKLIGKDLDRVETYPASEGFFAYQDCHENNGLLLLVNEHIFYEFIETSHVFEENPPRISLKDVKTGVNYALVLNSNAGLWGYLIGDTITFTSTKPYRIQVTGRIKHFTSAFGEHVIAEEVEQSLGNAVDKHPCEINEFTVAPMLNPPDEQIPYHEWFIEFNKSPQNPEAFRLEIDRNMQIKNSYYKDLIQGKMLQALKISVIQRNGFKKFMEKRGKLGGQNKVPRLTNDRTIADELAEYICKTN